METNFIDEEPSTTSPSLPSPPSESHPPPLDVAMNSPPLRLTPSLLDVDILDQQPQPDDEVESLSFHADFFPESAKVFGNGDTFLDLFDEDEYAEARRTNLYYPFASRPEWELASFLLKSDLSRVAIDQFLKLQLVSTKQSIELSAHFSLSSDSGHWAFIQNRQRPWQPR